MGIQNPRNEGIENLRQYVAEAVDNFGAKNQAAPKNIIFFRDGVSEGEYERVCQEEIQAIQGLAFFLARFLCVLYASDIDACKDVWAKRGLTDPLPLLTFIVVGKRLAFISFPEIFSSQLIILSIKFSHHSVFFPISPQ